MDPDLLDAARAAKGFMPEAEGLALHDAAVEGGRVGPAFTTIAAMPSTTGLALNVFLQSHHQWMPSVRLDRDEMDAVIDYILSLKAAEPATP